MNNREALPWRRLSRDPDGQPTNLLWLGGAGALLLLSVYSWVTAGTLTPFVPLLGAGFTLVGVAESLPATRRQTATRLRLVAILLQFAVVAGGLVGLLGGPQLLVS